MDRWFWDMTVLYPTSFASSPKRASDRVRAAPGRADLVHRRQDRLSHSRAVGGGVDRSGACALQTLVAPRCQDPLPLTFAFEPEHIRAMHRPVASPRRPVRIRKISTGDFWTGLCSAIFNIRNLGREPSRDRLRFRRDRFEFAIIVVTRSAGALQHHVREIALGACWVARMNGW